MTERGKFAVFAVARYKIQQVAVPGSLHCVRAAPVAVAMAHVAVPAFLVAVRPAGANSNAAVATSALAAAESEVEVLDGDFAVVQVALVVAVA